MCLSPCYKLEEKVAASKLQKRFVNLSAEYIAQTKANAIQENTLQANKRAANAFRSFLTEAPVYELSGEEISVEFETFDDKTLNHSLSQFYCRKENCQWPVLQNFFSHFSRSMHKYVKLLY